MKSPFLGRWIATPAAAVLLASGSWASAQSAPGNNGAPSLQVQSEAGALISQRAEHKTDLFTGSFGYSVPIVGAPARNGSEPGLALVYSSSGDNGWCGIGWTLDIGYIERNTKDGFPILYDSSTPPLPSRQYDQAKGFSLNLFGRQMKLLTNSANEYRAEVDSDFLRCQFDPPNNRWEVYDRSGTLFRFGYTARVMNPNAGWTANHTGTFRWALEEIITATGDRTTITYQTFATADVGTARVLYPDTISYNGHTSWNGYTASQSPTHTIQFDFGTRTDTRISYRSGFRVVQDRRLTNIVCQANSQIVRRYALEYDYSPATKRSRLLRVRTFGTDDSSELPGQSFGYQDKPFTFGPKVQWKNLALAGAGVCCITERDGFGNTIKDVFDLDGDSLPDRVRWDDTTTPDRYLLQRNLGPSASGAEGGFATNDYAFGATSDFNFAADDSAWSALNSSRVRIMDITGDGLPDRIGDDLAYMYGGGVPYNHFGIKTNHGAGFSINPSNTWAVEVQGSTFYYAIDSLTDTVSAGRTSLFDLNGDGLPDRVMMPVNPNYTNLHVQFGTGTNFSALRRYPYSSQGGETSVLWSGIEGLYSHMVDLNGDGLIDRVMLPRNPSTGNPVQDATLNKFVVMFNNGYSFEQQDWPGVYPQYSGLTPHYANVQKFPWVGLLDLTGDGLPDRVMPRHADGTKTSWLLYRNTGAGFDTVSNVISGIDIQNAVNTNNEHWYGLYGVGDARMNYVNGQTITAMLDINGDGLLDRVMADYPFANNPFNPSLRTNILWVQTNSGPYPDLMKAASNGIGGVLTVAYKPSTAWDNRHDPSNTNSGKLLPFPMQTVASVTENDGVNTNRTTSYLYEGGFYDGGRREFAGFAKVTETDASNRRQIYFYHQGGGQDRASSGEYLDAFAKRGMPYRIETYGHDTNVYHVVVHLVNQTNLGPGRWFPFVQQTFNYDYPGGGTPRITATRFAYNFATGNLTNKIVYGEVTNVSLTSLSAPTDLIAADTEYHHIIYAAISGNANILDHPDTIKLTSDAAGNTIVTEQKFTYNANSGTLATEQSRICTGQYATNRFEEYDTYGLTTRITDPVGVQTKISAFDALHIYPNVTRLRVTAGSDSSNDHITYTTNDVRSGLLTDITDPMGVRVQNTYDTFFRLTQTDQYPVGGAAVWVKKISYSPFAVLVSGTATNYAHTKINDGVDAVNGVESRTYFDGWSRPIQTRTEAEAGNYRVISTAYDERGEAFLTTWPRFEANVTFAKPTAQPANFTGFDAAGRVAQTRARVEATFNGNGAFSGKTDSTGDANSLLAPKLWAYTNGIDPWWKIYTDEDGKVRRYQLDAFGRNKQIQEVDGASTYLTSFRYDLAGNLTHITNHVGEVISYGHDDLGNVVAMADPHLGSWTYRRDAAGRIREQLDGKGQKIAFTYGATLSRLSLKQVYNAATQLVATATYSYDTNNGHSAYPVYKGQLFQVTDSEGWERNGYDPRGRMVKTTRHLDLNNQDYTTSFTFNDADRVTSTVYPNSGPTITNEYHAGGSFYRVSRSGYTYYTANAGSVGSENFDEFGRVKVFSFGNGQTTTRGYYSLSKRLQSISSGVFTREYRYSAAEDVTYLSGTGLAATTVTYDNLHRLKTYTGLSGSFGYDPVGNLTNHIESGSAQTFGYGAARKQAVKSAFGKTYLYDHCGNMVVRHGGTTNSQALEYDAENRLVRFSEVGRVAVEYGYSASGQRLWRRSYLTSTNSPKLQIWIGNHYEEKDGKTLFHVFAGGQRVCTFEPGSALATTGGGGAATHVGYFYHQDHLGSSTVMSGSAGQQLEINAHYPFGRTQTASSQAAFKVSNQFTGQVKDEETGLYYYNARYYDPELGRFIQPDTIIPDLTNPQSYNRYAYVLNNPLKYVDSTGHWPEWSYNWMPNSMLQYFNSGGEEAPVRTVSAQSNLGMLRSELPGYDGGDLQAVRGVMMGAAELNPIVGGFNAGYTTATKKHAIDFHKVSNGERIQASGATAAAALPVLARFRGLIANVWALNDIQRGKVIEQVLSRTDYAKENGWFHIGKEAGEKFPLVDFQKGNALVSLKSANTGGKSWFGELTKHIDDLATRGASVNGKPAAMFLDLRVQPGGADAASKLVDYGAKRGVGVSVKEF
jgi:RHS repeat-associated protein